MSGMVLIAAPHPELTAVCREAIGYRSDVEAVEYNPTGPLGDPVCTTNSTASCTISATTPCCPAEYPDLQLGLSWPPTPIPSYGSETPPNDPGFYYQWGMENIGQTLYDRTCGVNCAPQLATPNIEMDILKAWRRTTGSPSIGVAVLDSGIAKCNPDFDQSRFYEDDLALICDGRAGTPYPCCTAPPNRVCTYLEAGDLLGHGTFVASFIAATVNNNLGIAGVDQHCKILAATTVGETFESNMARVIIALEEIATEPMYEGVRVINMSTGHICEPPSGGETNSLSDLLRGAVHTVHAQNRFIVSISQNGGVGTADIWCPNAMPEVMMIGGVDGRGWRAKAGVQGTCSESGTGSALDFMGSGYAMLGLVCQADACHVAHAPSPCPYTSFACSGQRHNFLTGTSYAAPMVSGVISLLLARAEFLGINENFAEITFAEMYEILRQSCLDPVSDLTSRDPLDTAGWDPYYGHGLVNAHRAMLALERLHYKCRADRTAKNNPGTPGYGIPDNQITPADLAYFVARFPFGDIEACDVTSTGCVTLTAGCGMPDGIVDQSDEDYFMLFYNTSLTNCASLPCNCP